MKYYYRKSKKTKTAQFQSTRIEKRSRSFTKLGLTLKPHKQQANQSVRGDLHSLNAKRKKLFQLLVVVLTSLVILYLVISQLAFKVTLRVNNVNRPIEQTQLDKYSQTVTDYLVSRPLERLNFLLDKDDLFNYLSAKYPEIASVDSFETSFLSPSIARISFREPLAVWLSSSGKLYVDKQGISFKQNFFNEPDLKLIDKSGIGAQQGSQSVVASALLNFIGQMIYLSNEKGYRVKKVVIPPGTIRRVDVYLDNYNYPIKMTITRSVASQVEDMDLSLKHFGNNKLLYLDVRVVNQVYYK